MGKKHDANILDAISDMVFIHDLDDGRVLEVNQRACEAYGYSREEMLRLDVEQLWAGTPPYSQAEALALIQAAEAGQPQRADWLARRRNGETFWVDMALRKAAVGGQPRMLVTVRDIDERKRRELRLEQSEARYRSIYEQVPVSLWMEDWREVIAAVRSVDVAGTPAFADYLQDHAEFVDDCLAKVRIADVNPETLTLLGASSKESVLSSLATVFATDDTRPGFVGELLALGQGLGVYRSEMTLNKVDGSQFHVLLTMSFPAPDDASGFVLVSLMDISARVDAEQALRQERASLARLLNARGEALRAESARLQTAESLARVGSWQIDLHSGKAIWSPQTYRILGLDGDSDIASEATYLDRVQPEDRAGAHDFLAQARDSSQLCEHRHRILRPDGDLRQVHAYARTLHDEKGRALMIVGALQDVTDAWRARRRLEQSEQKFRGLFESIADGIAYTTLDGLITDFNPAFQAMLGYTPEEIRALRYPEFTPKRWHEMEAKIIEEQVFERGYSDEYEKEYRRKDGSVFPIRLRVSLVRDEAGQPAGLWGLIRDISEEKRLLDERERYNRALEAAVQDLEGFSSSVSHDLRAPLRAIDSYSKLVLEDYAEQLPEDARHMLGVVRRNAQKLARLIDDLLAFSRASRQDLKRERIDMTALCQAVFDELRAGAPERRIECRLAALPLALADPAAIRQVLVNLLSNALKFTAPRDPAHIEVSAECDGDECRYSVRDNGVGFDPAYVHKLFVVFSRLHAQDEFAGTGMGLAIVKRIVEKHGGRVWAESQPDQGACFGFALPQESFETAEKGDPENEQTG